MKAAIYNGKRNIILKELPQPKAGINDIVVKNLYATEIETKSKSNEAKDGPVPEVAIA